MIISDRHRFVFVHIPKCAGTSVRTILSPYDDYAGWFEGRVEHHPDLGEIDYVHLPLLMLKDVLPNEYKKLALYDAFALVRDPLARFQSAFAQRMKMYRGIELAQMTRAEIEQELEDVVAELEKVSFVRTPSMIHFARQSDFVAEGGRRVVTHIYPATRMDLLLNDLSIRIGEPIECAPPLNETQVASVPALSGALRAANRISKRIMPTTFRRALSARARKIFLRPLGDRVLPAFASPEVVDFVSVYYREDACLFEEAREAAEARFNWP